MPDSFQHDRRNPAGKEVDPDSDYRLLCFPFQTEQCIEPADESSGKDRDHCAGKCGACEERTCHAGKRADQHEALHTQQDDTAALRDRSTECAKNDRYRQLQHKCQKIINICHEDHPLFLFLFHLISSGAATRRMTRL